MTHVFGIFPQYDTVNNLSTNNNSNIQSNNTCQLTEQNTKMFQTNNYSTSINYDNSSYLSQDYKDNNSDFFFNEQFNMQNKEQFINERKPEIIHSGHFMVSEIDDADNELQNNEEEEEVIKTEEEIAKDNYCLIEENSLNEITDSFVDNSSFKLTKKNWNIDYPKPSISLDILFKRMNIGFESKLTTPKWKTFKGVKISLKDKIRLNNLIWRAWHINFILGRKPLVNPFPSKLNIEEQDNKNLFAHKPEKMNKFWKVNHNYIALEYMKWRRNSKEIFNKQRNLINSTNQWILEDSNNFNFVDTNEQYNISMFNALNNYSSSQLGFGAEYLQPDFSYGIQQEFMDTLEDPNLQNFLSYKTSFLPTLHEEDTVLENLKMQEMSPQSIFNNSTTNNNCNLNQNTLENDVNINYDQQLIDSSNSINNNFQQEVSSQATNSQLPTSPINYDFLNYQQTPSQSSQTIQQASMTLQNNNTPNQHLNVSHSFRQNYMQNNNILLEQQNLNINNSQNAQNFIANVNTNIQQNSSHQQNIPLNIDQSQINNNNQSNNAQFVVPKSLKQRIRSRSVSSLPQNQQKQLQQLHTNENSSSLMEISNSNSLQNTVNFSTNNNIVNVQQQQNTKISNTGVLNTFRHPINTTGDRYFQRRTGLNLIMNNQIVEQNNLQNSQNSNNDYYNNSLNDLNKTNNRTTQQQNSSIPLEYNSNSSLINNNISSSSYYNLHLNNSNSTNNQQTIQQNSNYNSNLNFNSVNKYATNEQVINSISSNNNVSLVSQLLNSNNKIVSNNSNNIPFKRNSTGNCPNFSYSSDQFCANSIVSTSVSNLDMRCDSSNNSNSSSNKLVTSTLNNNLNNFSNNQVLRKSSSMSLQASPGTYQSNQQSSTSNNNCFNSSAISNSNKFLNHQQSINDFKIFNKPNISQNKLTSSLENVSCKNINKNINLRSDKKQRKISTGRLRNNSLTNSPNLSKPNNLKPINNHNTLSSHSQNFQLPTSPMNQAIKNNNTKNFINFEQSSSSSLILNNNQPSLSSNSNNQIQSPSLANNNFALIQNDYSNESLNIYNQNSNSIINVNQDINQNLIISYDSNKTNKKNQKPQHQANLVLNNSSSSCHLSPIPNLSSNPIKNERDSNLYKEHRRVCHINAEQKRRCNIKHGFDTLRAILPTISSNNNTKISKAAMLQKGAEHIRQLRIEHETQRQEMETLRAQIDALNQTIGIFQNQLPATGAPISGMRPGQIKERFEDFVREKTLQNWKFWMFSIIMEPLLSSFNNTVLTTNIDELNNSVLRWLDQSCNLINLRRDVLNSLRIISTSTNVLMNPSSLSEESLAAVRKKQTLKKKNNILL